MYFQCSRLVYGRYFIHFLAVYSQCTCPVHHPLPPVSRVHSRPDLDPLRSAGTPTSYLCPTQTPNIADATEWSISHEPFFPLFAPTSFPIHSSFILDFLLFGLLTIPTHTIPSSDDTIVALYLYHRLTHALSCHSVTVTLTHVVYIV